MHKIGVKRLMQGDREHADALFLMMSGVSAEEYEQAGDACLDRLLGRSPEQLTDSGKRVFPG